MPQRSTIAIVVNGSKRRIVCEQGQEDHLQHAGKYLDKRLREMKSNVGNIPESELFVLTALMLIDDLSEAHTEIADLKKKFDLKNNATTPPTAAYEQNSLLSEGRLEQTTRRIEQLAKLFQTG